VISARSTESVHVDVAPGEVARWEFAIEAYDIAFTALFTPAGQEPVVAAEEARCEAGLARWRGEHSPAGGVGGRLELRFDNGHSMMRSKTVRWRAAAAAAPAAARAS